MLKGVQKNAASTFQIKFGMILDVTRNVGSHHGQCIYGLTAVVVMSSVKFRCEVNDMLFIVFLILPCAC